MITRRKGDPFTLPQEQLDGPRLRRFRRLVTGLNQLMEDIRKDWPEANYYLEGEGNLLVLSGSSHEGYGEAAQPHRELAGEILEHAGGGGW